MNTSFESRWHFIDIVGWPDRVVHPVKRECTVLLRHHRPGDFGLGPGLGLNLGRGHVDRAQGSGPP